MLTEEQKAKGRIALLPSIEDFEKSRALERHKRACKGMTLYGLPYRVYLDYLKRWDSMTPEERDNLVEINPCYPEEGYPLDKIRIVTPSDLDMSNVEVNDKGYPVLLPFEDISTLKPHVQAEIEKSIEPLRKWKHLDDNWRCYFSHFLKGYEFKDFTEFDFSGTSGDMTPEDLGLLRNLYERVRAEYDNHELDYLEDEPRTTPERKRQYSEKPYRVLWDRGTIVEREELIKQMGINPTYTDEEYTLVYGTEDDTDDLPI